MEKLVKDLRMTESPELQPQLYTDPSTANGRVRGSTRRRFNVVRAVHQRLNSQAGMSCYVTKQTLTYLLFFNCYFKSCFVKDETYYVIVLKPTLAVLEYWVSNVRHVQSATPQTYYEGSMFLQARAFFFLNSIVFMMNNPFFFSPVRLQFSWSFFETCIFLHLLHILFLEPLHSVRDRHPYSPRVAMHRATYDLRSSCCWKGYKIFSGRACSTGDSLSVKKMLWYRMLHWSC